MTKILARTSFVRELDARPDINQQLTSAYALTTRILANDVKLCVAKTKSIWPRIFFVNNSQFIFLTGDIILLELYGLLGIAPCDEFRSSQRREITNAPANKV